jgi:hypothetical protein
VTGLTAHTGNREGQAVDIVDGEVAASGFGFGFGLPDGEI